MTDPKPIVKEVRVAGFRTARDLTLEPAAVCALVGEAKAGKSNLLAAIHAVLDPTVTASVTSGDVPDGAGTVHVTAKLATEETIEIAGAPPRLQAKNQGAAPAVVLLAAEQRAGNLVAAPHPSHPLAVRTVSLFTEKLAAQLDDSGRSSASAAHSMVDAVEACCAAGLQGVVLLVEEPELYLGPQAQRYLYRLLRRFAGGGNQVIYSTHSPAFLNVARLDELVFVQRLPASGSRAVAPRPVTPEEDFRVLSEFDAERAELFLARAALLVEGLTEKLAMPFVFAALGIDADAEGISIVECGGKSNIPLFGRVCAAAGVPFLALHDRDARRGGKPSRSEARLNTLIAEIAGAARTIALEPDFEGAAGLRRRARKPKQAWSDFSRRTADDMPEGLKLAAQLTTELARAARTVGSSTATGRPEPDARSD